MQYFWNASNTNHNFQGVEITTDGDCKKWADPADNLLCGGKTWDMQPCKGDYGGGLFLEENVRYTLIGIAVYADDCLDYDSQPAEEDKKPGYTN